MIIVYLGIGSNLGDRQLFLDRAQQEMDKIPETRFLRSAAVYETDPVGGPPQGKYLNTVWEIETALTPEGLKKELIRIENRFGRKRREKNAPREIDLDILLFGDQIVKIESLKIPHPRMQERAFVMVPLSELASDFRHPILKKSMRELARGMSL